ncbi:MAG: metallophosphoesterase [Acidobacteriota bacterium]
MKDHKEPLPKKTSTGDFPERPARGWSRRRFLASAAALAATPAGALLYAREIEPHWLDVVRLDLPIVGLPSALDGRTLLHLSDLHVGVVDREFLSESFRVARALNPDLVAYTGDWVSYIDESTLDELEVSLDGLPIGRLGTYGVLGNHDYGHNWQMPKVAARIQRIVEAAGVRLLRNEAEEVAGLQIIGLEDLWGPYFTPGDVLQRHGGRPASLVLCHNPDAADRSVWHDYSGWILSGHTHGGQCKPPFLPPPILPVENRRYTAGVIEVDDRRRLYINPGLGYLKRVRFNMRPELTLFTLRPAGDERGVGRAP